MKVAILSDIHGNKPALDAVLQDIKQHEIDNILILGDFLTDFAEMTIPVLNTIRNLNAYVIRGNREGYLIEAEAKGELKMWSEHKHYASALNTYKQLTKVDLAYLESLPKQISLVYDDVFSLRMVHGSPFSEFDQLKEGQDDLIERSANAITEKILLCGHTHMQMVKYIGEKIIINVGTVGSPVIGGREGLRENISIANYTIISYFNNKIDIEMKNIEYDYSALKTICTDISTYLCYKSIEDGVSRFGTFLKEAIDKAGCFPIPDAEWEELYLEWCEKGVIKNIF